MVPYDKPEESFVRPHPLIPLFLFFLMESLVLGHDH